MSDETIPHFARPVHFNTVHDTTCAFCRGPIYLYENPDGRKVWRHKES
jgi:hypothetical protein